MSILTTLFKRITNDLGINDNRLKLLLTKRTSEIIEENAKRKKEGKTLLNVPNRNYILTQLSEGTLSWDNFLALLKDVLRVVKLKIIIEIERETATGSQTTTHYIVAGRKDKDKEEKPE